MFTITKLKMWKDPGYTRQCVEVPPRGSKKLPTPDWVSSGNLKPRPGSMLSAIELPMSYIEVMDMSYLYIEAEDGQTVPNIVKVFGWITRITEVATSNANVRIEWTPDYWRTYSSDAVFGKGTITRCANDTYKRPYMTEPRKWIKKSELADPFNSTAGIYFVMMVSEKTGTDITGFCYYWAEVDGPSDPDAHTRTFTSSEIYSGTIDEYIHDPNNNPIVPSSIIGAWIVPGLFFTSAVGPFEDYQTLSTTVPGFPNNWTVTYRRSTRVKSNAVETNRNVPGLTAYGSDDLKRCVAVDPYGQVSSMLPWGFAFTSNYVDMTIDISADGITMYYCDHAIGLEKAIEEGNYLMFNGLPVPVNSNAWSEYAYTYQRSYDKRMREIQRNQKAVEKGTSISSNLVGGSISYLLGGKEFGAGMLGHAIGSAVELGINYYTDAYFNDELQRESDKLASNQASNMLLPGGGLAWKNIAGLWKIVQLEGDSVSVAEYGSHITNDGYTVEIPVGNPDAFVLAGGPLQIQNLMVTGAVPPEAKTYIKNILSNGVRIVENNPSGVEP